MVANGCTTGCMKPPYGFAVSNSRPMARIVSQDCGPAYSEKLALPSTSGITTVPTARVASLLSRGPTTACSSANGVESLGDSTPTTKYFVLATAQESGPATS